MPIKSICVEPNTIVEIQYIKPSSSSLVLDVSSSKIFVNESTVLDMANEIIESELSKITYLKSSVNQIKAISYFPMPNDKNGLSIKYKLDWVEWSDVLPLDEYETKSKESIKVKVDKINLEIMKISILNKNKIQTIIKNCSTALELKNRKLEPPFFNILPKLNGMKNKLHLY